MNHWLRRARVLIVSAVACLGLGSVVMPANATEAPSYPVTWSLAGGFFGDPLGSLDPATSPLGSNHWDCKPSAAHPRPVVLVHALLANQTLNWPAISPLLADNGYCVFSLTYGNQWWLPTIGGLRSMRIGAQQLSDFVDRVLEATGASQVDLVGHSEGTSISAWYLKELGGAPKVKNLVAFSPNYSGTTLYGLTNLANALPWPLSSILEAACETCKEYYRGSSFETTLNSGGTAAVPGVTYTDIQATIEEVVLPNSSGQLNVPNATNTRVSDGCALDQSDHVSIATSKRAAQIMLNALDPAHTQPLPCAFNPPFLS